MPTRSLLSRAHEIKGGSIPCARRVLLHGHVHSSAFSVARSGGDGRCGTGRAREGRVGMSWWTGGAFRLVNFTQALSMTEVVVIGLRLWRGWVREEWAVVQTGRVVRFDDVRGFGFIAPEGGSGQDDVFLHVNGLVDGEKSLPVGTRVSFQVMEGQRGLKAYEVKVIGEDEIPPVQTVSTGRVPDLPEGDMCDVLTRAELTAELTEALLAAEPSLTGAQILKVRSALLELASSHEWVID